MKRDACLLGTRFVAVTSLSAVALGYLCYFAVDPGLVHDARWYWLLGIEIARKGLFEYASDVRTYGYPLFVTLVTAFTPLDPQTSHFIVFHAQLLLLVVVGLYGARRLARVLGSRRLGRAAYVLSVLNVVLVAHATEHLNDLLAALLLYLALVLSLAEERHAGAGPRMEPRAFAAFLCAALAAVVRPAAMLALPALALLWAIRAQLFGDVRRRAIAWMLVGMALPFVPQLTSNYRAFGAINPLIVRGLYSQQTTWGMQYLKYGTLMTGGPPKLFYANPFYRAEVGTPLGFARDRPGAYAATLGLHLFAMHDHDFLFSYIETLHPWYRWPLALLNYLFIFAVLTGLGAGAVRFVREPKIDERRFAGLAALMLLASSTAVYVPTGVESRFSLPTYLLGIPLVLSAVAMLETAIRRRRWQRVCSLAVGAAAFCTAAAWLSIWLQSYAPALHEGLVEQRSWPQTGAPAAVERPGDLLVGRIWRQAG